MLNSKCRMQNDCVRKADNFAFGGYAAKQFPLVYHDFFNCTTKNHRCLATAVAVCNIKNYSRVEKCLMVRTI